MPKVDFRERRISISGPIASTGAKRRPASRCRGAVMIAAPNKNLADLKRLPLHDLHVQLGAAMRAFAGYAMPVHYAPGVLKEHLHVRTATGLFDVSHMGQIVLRPRTGTIENAARTLERLAPVDLLGLPQYRLRYSFFTNANGGIEDDLMVGNCADHFMLVVNASRKERNAALLRAVLSDVCTIEMLSDRVLLSLQGPGAEDVLTALSPPVASMQFMDVRLLAIGGTDCIITRSGYTGEDGFEISIVALDAERFVRELLRNPAVRMAGLGARDSLRTEAGLCLYGADLDANATPVEAALEWTIPHVRRDRGERAGGFPRADIVLEQLNRGGPGIGSIGAKAHLAPYLPSHAHLAAQPSRVGPVAAAPYGSASILTIAWAYMLMMGGDGLAQATKVAILNANYVATRLHGHFPLLFRGRHNRVAHECIIDLRPFKDTAQVTVEDVAKRLIDYGFHAPTISFPVAGTMMIEPTESEPLTELDRFCDAMILIRKEIREIENGNLSKIDNPLKNAPHTAIDLIDWTRSYPIKLAAFPVGTDTEKYWCPVNRIDNVYGDRHLFCTCIPPDAIDADCDTERSLPRSAPAMAVP